MPGARRTARDRSARISAGLQSTRPSLSMPSKRKADALGQPLLVGMHQVQDDHFPAAMAEEPQRGEDFLQVVHEEIADQQQHAAPPAALEQLAQARGHARSSAACAICFDRGVKPLQVRERWPRRQHRLAAAGPSTARPTWSCPRLITWARADGEVLGILEFRAGRRPARCPPKVHRAAGVQGQRAEQVGLLLVDADEGLAGPAQDFPIQPPQVLAAGVFAEIDELARPALLPRGVVAAVGTLDAMPRGEPHVLQCRQRGRSRNRLATGVFMVPLLAAVFRRSCRR